MGKNQLNPKRVKMTLKKWVKDTSGNSIPLVMMVALVVMIVGGAVAYSAVQVFSIVRSEAHHQYAYFAAESALERSLCNLDSVITKENYAKSRGIVYNGEANFIDAIIDSLNDESNHDIYQSFSDIKVYGNDAMNGARVSLHFEKGNGFERVGLKRLRFLVTITATAQMENGIFKSYGKKAVATRPFTVWISDRFELNGAAYTLGDLVADSNETTAAPTEIEGDVYVFGTGLDRAKRMEQYYNGGICAIGSAIMHIKNGSAYTRNLVRAGSFDEAEISPSCAIIVDEDIVAQGIQVFGSNDSIVAIRDAYTFDDVELNGANSYIAVKGNYFGLNYGDGKMHDTSSAIINTAPLYGGGLDNNYMKSRIVINGHVFVNGTSFRVDPATGVAIHKMEDVALAWDGNQPVYIKNAFIDNFEAYQLALRQSGIHGFSVILQTDWGAHDELENGNWENWLGWISEIQRRAGFLTSHIAIPETLTGFSHNAMAANNRMYFIDSDQINIPNYFSIAIADNIENLDSAYFDDYLNQNWEEYTGTNGISKGLTELMNVFIDHVQVFARKKFSETPAIEDPDEEEPNIDNDNIIYSYTEGFEGNTEFMTIANHLESYFSGEPSNSYILKYDRYDTGPVGYVNTDLADAFPDMSDPYTDHFFLILNFNPDKELRITNQVNGIVFSMGKVVIEENGRVNGSVIAAGRGYDSQNKVEGSAADYEDDGITPRLPRVVIHEDGTNNISNFKNWDYAALLFKNGGSIVFPGRDVLLTILRDDYGIDLFDVF